VQLGWLKRVPYDAERGNLDGSNQRRILMQSLKEGQFVKHVNYGLGVVTQSTDDRTSIDFHLHGIKKFSTQLMTIELTNEAPPPKSKASRSKKAASVTSPAAAR
jgi:hypothetical protein